MAAATTARGLLMPSLRLMPLLRLSLDMAAMAVAMAVTDMAAATTARGRLRLSPATATVVDTAMVATDMVVMVAMATARGLLSLAMAMAAMVATAMAGATVAMAATAGAMATGV